MNKEMQIIDKSPSPLGMISVKNLPQEEKEVLKATVAKGTTDTELAYFLTVAAAQDLNPWKKEVWCYKNAKKNQQGEYDYSNADLIIMTGRDGYLKMAKRMPTFKKIQSSEVRENDQFAMDPITGKIEHRISAKSRGNILGAYAIITEKDGTEHCKYVTFSEYNNPYSPVWKSKPSAQICKCAESNLCKQFANITGIVAEETFDKNMMAAVDGSPERAELQESIKDQLLKDLDACTTILQINELARNRAVDIGKLFEKELQEVMAKAREKRIQLKGTEEVANDEPTEEEKQRIRQREKQEAMAK